MQIQPNPQNRSIYYKSTAIATATVVSLVALAALIAVAAYHGKLGSFCQSWIQRQFMPLSSNGLSIFKSSRLIVVTVAAASILGSCFIVSFVMNALKKQANNFSNEPFKPDVLVSPKDVLLGIATSLEKKAPQQEPKTLSSSPIESPVIDANEPSIEIKPQPIELASSQAPIEHMLPDYLKTEEGIFGSSQLLFFLAQQEDEMQQTELAKLFFSCRKFLTTDYTFDYYSNSDFEKNWVITNRQGHARSKIEPEWHTKHFIPSNNDIITIHPCEQAAFFEGKRIGFGWKGVYKDGKHILQQPTSRTSAQACAAMLILDRNEKLDIDRFFTGTLTIKRVPLVIDSAKKMIAHLEEYGSCVAEVEDPIIGKHNILIDSVNRGVLDHYATVTIRDPFHGWRITIPLRVLKNLKPSYYHIN